MWEIGKNPNEAIRGIGIVEIDEVIDQVKGIAGGLAPALVGGDVAIEVVVQQWLGIFVRYRRCSAAALPKSGAPQAIDTVITEMVALDVATGSQWCSPAQAGNVAVVLRGFSIVRSLIRHAHAEGVG